FTATSCPAANGGVTITVTYPSAIPPGAQYYKYGKEAGNTIDHYYTIPATVSGNQVTFTITDGQLGDNDLVANGTIIDPGAIGVPAAAGGPAVQPVPTLSQYALMALALGMFLMAARRRQGKRRR
ncbi:MAG: IPTL-CTERM sorting domain-containing protein, partial [Ottowia sp.]|nr:IPTL-CTERM sorting domain-containing protein [Ottowia sp.]